MRLRAGAIPALALTAALGPGSLGAATVRIWVSDSASDFSTGEARGVSVSSSGTLFLGRALGKVEGVSEPVLFSATPGKGGDLFVATGDSGAILRVPPTGKSATEIRLDEQEVTALATGPDGALYAGGSPGGKVYRIQNGAASVYYDTKAQYVWALAFDGPVLYVGTGLPGEIHRVAAAGKGERVHAASDPHVRALYVDGEGRVWAGTSGSGLLLRLDRSGRVATVYDSSKQEVASIAGDRTGRVWAAFTSADGASPSSGGEPISLPAALPPPKAPRNAAAGEDDDHGGKAEVSVSVSSPRLAPGRSASHGGYSSEVVLFDGAEVPRPVWSSSDEIVFELARDPAGEGVLAGNGAAGQAVRAHAGFLGARADVRREAGDASSPAATSAPTDRRRSTGPPRAPRRASTSRRSRTPAARAASGLFAGRETCPGGRGSSSRSVRASPRRPTPTWSGWSALDESGSDSARDSRPGRALSPVEAPHDGARGSDAGRAPRRGRVPEPQRDAGDRLVHRARTRRGARAVGGRAARTSSRASAPDERGIFTGLEEPRSEGAPRKLFRKGYRTLQWKASDPDGDPLSYELEFRPASGGKWILLRKDIRDTFYSFDATALPDGDYVFRLRASDAETNPGDAADRLARDVAGAGRQHAAGRPRDGALGRGPRVFGGGLPPRRSSRPSTASTPGSGRASSRRTASRTRRASPTSSTSRPRQRADTSSSASPTRPATSRPPPSSRRSGGSAGSGIESRHNRRSMNRGFAAILLGAFLSAAPAAPRTEAPAARPRRSRHRRGRPPRRPRSSATSTSRARGRRGRGRPAAPPDRGADDAQRRAPVERPEAQVLQYVQRNLFDFDSTLRTRARARRVDRTVRGRPRPTRSRCVPTPSGRTAARHRAATPSSRSGDRGPEGARPVFKPLFEELVSASRPLARGASASVSGSRTPFAPMAFVLPLLPAHRFERQKFLTARDNRAPLSDGPVPTRLLEDAGVDRPGAQPALRRGRAGHFDRIGLPRSSPTTRPPTAAARAASSTRTSSTPASSSGRPADSDFAACCRLVEFYNLDYNYIALNNRSPSLRATPACGAR